MSTILRMTRISKVPVGSVKHEADMAVENAGGYCSYLFKRLIDAGNC